MSDVYDPDDEAYQRRLDFVKGVVPHKPGSPNWHAPATPKQSIFKPGTGGDRDPDFLWSTVAFAEAEEWLATVRAHLDARCRRAPTGPRARSSSATEPLYTEWERAFACSLTVQLTEARALGRARPFSGKQLVVLKRMLDALAAATADVLARDGDGT